MQALRTPFVLLAATVFAGLGAACSSTNAANPDQGAAAEHAGGIDLDLTAGGATIDTVSYSITGPGAFSKTGTIDVRQSTKISASIGGLPAGTGFTITLTGTSVDGSLTCAGSATFNVTVHQTVPVTVSLDCHEAARTGSALVTGQLNVCPQIDSVDTNPAEVTVGGSVGLSATAHDTDHAPSALSYHWAASSGTITDAWRKTPDLLAPAREPRPSR